MRETIFITGMQRSGTTLLLKLLDAQPAFALLSQPFPLLFVEAKRAFLDSRALETDGYPLGHLFRETRYDGADFARFLSAYALDRARAGELYDEMRRYSGQYTRFDRGAFEAALTPAPFVPMLRSLYENLAAKGATFVGGKETTCEELLPPLLTAGVRSVLIVRDPRDVIASLNHGQGEEFGGRPKPTLFNVRQWRKSVAFALALEDTPRFHWLRYEELVADPAAQLSALAARLEMGDLDHQLRDGISTWTGNSSYGPRHGVSQESVGAYRRVLPPEVARFIEATCAPELRLLGYEVALDDGEAAGIIESFREPYDTRPELAADAPGPENTRHELRRLELLRRDAVDDVEPYFLFHRTYERLRASMPR